MPALPKDAKRKAGSVRDRRARHFMGGKLPALGPGTGTDPNGITGTYAYWDARNAGASAWIDSVMGWDAAIGLSRTGSPQYCYRHPISGPGTSFCSKSNPTLAAAIRYNTAWTMALRVYASSSSSGQVGFGLSTTANFGGVVDGQFVAMPGGTYCWFRFGDSQYSDGVSWTPAFGWYTLICTHSAARVCNTYYQGTLKDTYTMTGAAPSGSRVYTNIMCGDQERVGFVAVYDHVLDATERSTLHTAWSAVYP